MTPKQERNLSNFIFKNAKEFTNKHASVSFPKEVEDYLTIVAKAALEARKRGEKITVAIPLFNVKKIDVETLIFLGQETPEAAARNKRRPREWATTLAQLYIEYGFVAIVDEKGRTFGSDITGYKEVEKVVTKEKVIKEQVVVKSSKLEPEKVEKVREKMKQWIKHRYKDSWNDDRIKKDVNEAIEKVLEEIG